MKNAMFHGMSPAGFQASLAWLYGKSPEGMGTLARDTLLEVPYQPLLLVLLLMAVLISIKTQIMTIIITDYYICICNWIHLLSSFSLSLFLYLCVGCVGKNFGDGFSMVHRPRAFCRCHPKNPRSGTRRTLNWRRTSLPRTGAGSGNKWPGIPLGCKKQISMFVCFRCLWDLLGFGMFFCTMSHFLCI